MAIKQVPYQSSPRRQPAVVQCIGRWGLTAQIMNSVIGAGIFGLPATIAQATGSFALWAYVLGAAMAAIIVAVVAELSSQFNEPGGAYLYVSRAFGQGLGIQTGWFSFLARITTAAAIANLLMRSLSGLVPEFLVTPYRITGLAVVLGTLAAVNIRSTRDGLLTSNGLLVLKVLPLVVLVIAGILRWDHGTAPEATSAPSWKGWRDALIAMLFAFSGFESAMIPGRDIREPKTTTPPAAFGALVAIFLLYLLLHLVTMRALPTMAASASPLTEAAAVYLGYAGETLMLVAAVASTLGWLSGAALSAPRLTESMAEAGVFPKAFALKTSQDSPPWASIVVWAVLVFALASYGTFTWNVVLSVAARLVVYSTMCASLPRLRKKRRWDDAWRVPFGPLISSLGIAICALLASRLEKDHIVLMSVVAVVAIGTWFVGPHRSVS